MSHPKAEDQTRLLEHGHDNFFGVARIPSLGLAEEASPGTVIERYLISPHLSWRETPAPTSMVVCALINGLFDIGPLLEGSLLIGEPPTLLHPQVDIADSVKSR